MNHAMRYISSVLISLLLSSIARAGARPSCDLDHLSQWISRSTRFSDIRHEVFEWISDFPTQDQGRILKAANEVLSDYKKAGKPIPPLKPSREHIDSGALHGTHFAVETFRQETIEQGNQWFTKMSQTTPSENRLSSFLFPIRLEAKSDSGVYQFELDGKKWIFRTAQLGDNFDARLTLSAARLNELMNLDTVPRAHFGQIKKGVDKTYGTKMSNQYGVISESVDGKKMQTEDYIEELTKQADAHSLRDAECFEFLIGNSDVHPGNFLVDPSNKVKVYDHNRAFLPFPTRYRGYAHLGRMLPALCTSHFVEELKKLTPERLRQEMGEHLQEYEIQTLLFRRDLMLKDIELRGVSAILPKKGGL